MRVKGGGWHRGWRRGWRHGQPRRRGAHIHEEHTYCYPLRSSSSYSTQCWLTRLSALSPPLDPRYVDPNKGHAGFSPHRDRQPPDAAATFRPDGSAMYSTCWVALTDAVPDNSCLYVLPRHADPGYVDGDLEGE